MRIKGLTITELHRALDRVNKEQGYQLIFNRYPEKKGNFYNFTIRSKKSGIAGSRTGFTGRKLISASWHAHGYFFDEVLKMNNEAIIWSGKNKITSESGNWIDWNIGSLMYPMSYSETSIL